MKIKDLLETPVVDYETFGDFDRNSSFRKPIDRRLVSNPAMIKRTKHAFEKVNKDFHMYFINSPKANLHTEIGTVSLDWVEHNLDPEVYEKVAADYKENSDYGIFIIYTNNKGSEWKPMTPWIMAHRFGHAVARNNFSMLNPQPQFYSYGELNRALATATTELLYLGFGADVEFHNMGRMSSPRKYQLLYKNFWQAHMTFKSARDKKIRDWFEITNEVIAQYIITGSVPIKQTPQPFTANRKRYVPNNKNDIGSEFADMAAVYSRDMKYYIDNLLGEATGSILVM